MSEPLVVTIIPGDPITANPLNELIPWQYDGPLIFTIQEGAGAIFDVESNGIVFQSGAPYTRILVAPEFVVFKANNDNQQQTGTQFQYEVFLIAATMPFGDPTVENEPPSS